MIRRCKSSSYILVTIEFSVDGNNNISVFRSDWLPAVLLTHDRQASVTDAYAVVVPHAIVIGTTKDKCVQCLVDVTSSAVGVLIDNCDYSTHELILKNIFLACGLAAIANAF